MVDKEKYIKEAEVIEGGFLDLGFQKYLVRFEIVGQKDGPTIIRSTIKSVLELWQPSLMP
jgi:hypothetical protein